MEGGGEMEVVGRRGGGEGVAVEIGEEVMGGGAELLVGGESFNFLFLRLNLNFPSVSSCENKPPCVSHNLPLSETHVQVI